MADKVRVNQRIRAKAVRVIGEDGEQVGVMSVEEGLRLAGENSLDLVEVAPKADPPVCRIMDYGKYKYQRSKRVREAKKHQHTVTLKEIKFRPKTDEHDYQFKLNHIRRFLTDGNKVKVTVFFRGREMVHMELGAQILERVVEDIHDLGEVDQRPQREGRTLMAVIAPKH